MRLDSQEPSGWHSSERKGWVPGEDQQHLGLIDSEVSWWVPVVATLHRLPEQMGVPSWAETDMCTPVPLHTVPPLTSHINTAPQA